MIYDEKKTENSTYRLHHLFIDKSGTEAKLRVLGLCSIMPQGCKVLADTAE